MASELAEIREAVLVKANGISRAVPVDIEGIARSLGVVEIEPRAIHFDGYLARRSDGQLAIRYKQDAPRSRIRFTIAHEVGHILIANALGRPIEGQVNRAQFRDDEEERLANRIASELLLPRDVLLRILANRPVSWRAVDEIIRRCDASESSVLIRIKELDFVRPIEISIDLGNRGRTPLRVFSRGYRSVLFCRPPGEEAMRLSVERSICGGFRSGHHIRLDVDGVVSVFRLLGTLMRSQLNLARFFTWSMQLARQHTDRELPSVADEESNPRTVIDGNR